MKASPEELKKRYGGRKLDASRLKTYHSISGFAHPELAVITTKAPDEFSFMKWGLIPFWTQDEMKGGLFAKNNLNAKSETVFHLPSFKSVIKSKRCIIPVTGFFEWRDCNKQKYPYYITLKEESIFSLGGIFDTWPNKSTGEIINSFSIITTPANPLMAKIHNLKERMPLILPRVKEELWITPDAPESTIKELMHPFDDNLMKAHTISKRITNRKEDPNNPATTEPFDYPELALFD